jgi:GT2 family glycosyltransferase
LVGSRPRTVESTIAAAGEAPASATVAVIVLNWNGCEDTVACVEALRRMETEHTVLVVDNGSSDDSERRLRDAFPTLDIVQTGANLGYAGGNNIGIRRALADKPDFIWILNNDALPRANSLAELLGAVGPRIGVLASRTEPSLRATALRGQMPVSCDGCEVGFHETDRVIGPSLFFRSEIFEKLGLFDEHYFHYLEDDDMATRAHRAGWRLGLACGSVVDHVGGASLAHWSPQASYYMVRNRTRFDRRFNKLGTTRSLIRNRRSLWAHIAPRRSLRERDARRATAVLFAVTDAARGRFGRRDLGSKYWVE